MGKDEERGKNGENGEKGGKMGEMGKKRGKTGKNGGTIWGNGRRWGKWKKKGKKMCTSPQLARIQLGCWDDLHPLLIHDTKPLN